MIAELMQYCRPPLSGIAVPYVDAKITQVSYDMVWEKKCMGRMMLYWTRLLWASWGGVNIGYSGYSASTRCSFPNTPSFR